MTRIACRYCAASLFVLYLFVLAGRAYSAEACQEGEHGGQCVAYVRNQLGGDREKMPGLCLFAKDCGAYLIWDHWDLGFGRGQTPKLGAILVIDKRHHDNRDQVGHCAIVTGIKELPESCFILTVTESNRNNDEVINCNVKYYYVPKVKLVQREGSLRSRRVLGFVYTR